MEVLRKTVVGISSIGLAISSTLLFKEYFGGSNYEGGKDLTGKTVIITGATSGIGHATALAMAQRKARVIMACRDMDKCDKVRTEIGTETKNKDIVCVKCDLASQESIRNFAKIIDKTEDRIDILINNAGVMRCKRYTTKEGIELQLGTNHMGHFLLTNLLLNKIKSSAPSRIVNVSSIAHKRGEINFKDLNSVNSYDEAGAYNQSKLANVLFTRELAKRLEGTGVTCNAVHPGLVNTPIMRHMGFYDSYIANIIVTPIFWLFLKNSRQGAQASIRVALSPDLEKTTGKYFSGKEETEVSEEAKNDVTAKRLWDTSIKWTRLDIRPSIV